MASKRKRRRKKTGFTIHTLLSDCAPHRDFQLEREREKSAYLRRLELERENH